MAPANDWQQAILVDMPNRCLDVFVGFNGVCHVPAQVAELLAPGLPGDLQLASGVEPAMVPF